MKMKTFGLLAAFLLFPGLVALAQNEEEEVNDTNSPLHLLQPDYRVPYGLLSVDDVKGDMDRVLHYLEACTPMGVVNTATGEAVTDYKKMPDTAGLQPGTFRLTSYEWGVTYSAMLCAAEATGDQAYADYAVSRMSFLAEMAPYFKELLDKTGEIDGQMRQVVAPAALDDAGAVCAAMEKALAKDPSLNLMPLIDNYMDFVMNKEYRLADGTFARTRPQYNTLWLDDMFMGVPTIACYSLVAKENPEAYLHEAVKQVLQFAQRMWVPEKNLFRHGWVESMADHPAFHWGRANGWAILTMCEVLDLLPEDFEGRAEIMELYRAHVRGLAALQQKDGFWHQLLDRNDSYEETSATAIYAYCLAHGINKGWLDPLAYAPVVQLAWHAVATQINEKGQVENTCVGTGMGFDPAYYCYRPVNVFAAHGYGPVIWAGAEVINMLNTQNQMMNDSAVQYYRTKQNTTEPIFHVEGE